jgi:hypothetical protein
MLEPLLALPSPSVAAAAAALLNSAVILIVVVVVVVVVVHCVHFLQSSLLASARRAWRVLTLWLLWLKAPKRLIFPVSTSASVAARSLVFFTLMMQTELHWRFLHLLSSTTT